MTTTEKLDRYIIVSDESQFIGRLYDLSIVSLHFESYEELSRYADALYVLNVNNRASLLTDRVESLNHIGDLLWPEKPLSIDTLPISAFEWCNLVHDAFLMRVVSVLDCCCLLTAEVLQIDIPPRRVNISSISKVAPANLCVAKLEEISDLQRELRAERNVRFHAAENEPLTDDDQTFRTVSLFCHRGGAMTGRDRHGREIDLEKFYQMAIDQLRQKFNSNVQDLAKALEGFYDSLNFEFEDRFRVMCRASGSYMQKSRNS